MQCGSAWGFWPPPPRPPPRDRQRVPSGGRWTTASAGTSGPPPHVRRAVIDLGSARPVWHVPQQTVDTVRRALGASWDTIQVSTPAISDGDGARASAEAVAAACGAEVYFGWGVPVGVARAARGTLRWAHTASAGARASLSPEFLATGAVLTNSRGVQAEPMADWTIAAIAFCLRGLHVAVQAQRAHDWAKDSFTDGRVTVRELAGTRVGIVGLGGVGRAVARRCHALGMEVRATRRRPAARWPRGVLWVGDSNDLVPLARRSDVLVITAPETPDTEGLVNEEALAALPNGSFVINVSRGVLVNEAALLRHLESDHLAGCVLDVFADEPLPRDHPFWDHPKVLVTPHISAVSTQYWERETSLIVENIERYHAGRRLKNRVDPELGY